MINVSLRIIFVGEPLFFSTILICKYLKIPNITNTEHKVPRILRTFNENDLQAQTRKKQTEIEIDLHTTHRHFTRTTTLVSAVAPP